MLLPLGKTRAFVGSWVWGMLRIVAAVLVSIALLPQPAAASGKLMRLLDPKPVVLDALLAPDLVTAYSTTMASYRSQFAGRRGDEDLSTPLGPTGLLKDFRARTWRAADGSLLQAFAGNAGFRLTIGDCLARRCKASECSDDGWPNFQCTDGHRRRMAVSDFSTTTFDSVAYRRLSAPAADSTGSIEVQNN
jgi:hypothetical protein